MQASGLGDDDIVEQDGKELPGWARPGWLRVPDRLRAPGRRPARGAVILGIAGLLIGLSAGYGAGYWHSGRAPRQAAASASAPSGAASSRAAGAGSGSSGPGITRFAGIVLDQSGEQCSQQHGRELQVGVQVTNQSSGAIVLGQVTPVLPLGGLRVVGAQWAPCGVISPMWQSVPAQAVTPQEGSGTVRIIALQGDNAIPPGGSAWVSVTFQVLVRCPGPLPVQFAVGYETAGQAATAHLPGFPDLSQVPYSGCP